MKYDEKLIIEDRIAPMGQKILSVKADRISSGVGIESEGYTGTNSTAIEYMLKGLTPELVRSIRNGESYLVFEIEAIDHSKPTSNNKLYPADVFLNGMANYGFQNQLRKGGVCGENEHPDLIIDNKDPEAAFQATMQRLHKTPGDNVTHRVIAYRQADNKTYFTIKTSTTNPHIALEMLNGIAPGFSIRTVGNFDNTQSPIVAREIEVIGIDYVQNPANWNSVFVGGQVQVYDTVNMKVINLELVQRTAGMFGTESSGSILSKFIGNESTVLIDPSNPSIIAVRTPIKEKKEVSFEDAMNMTKLSIFKEF